MQITIKVVSVEIENKGKYKVAEVFYKDIGQNKSSSKKLMSFVHKQVYETVSACQGGETFEVTLEKDDKGYWQWTAINEPGAAPATTAVASKSGTASPKSTYETAEERAKRQVMIVRQSSLATAVAALKTEKNVVSPEELISFAKELESYVLDLQPPKSTSKLPQIDELDDDIPL